MVNKEKLLLLATIYMLVPGALPDALAESSESNKSRAKKTHVVQNPAHTKKVKSVKTAPKQPPSTHISRE